jgi:hypothetical protein
MPLDQGQTALLAELRSLLPLRVVAAKWGYGSFITLDLAGGSSDASLHIWIYLCSWLIYQGDEKVHTSSSEAGDKGAPIACFEGRTLTEIGLDADDRAMDLFLDQDLSLLLSPNLTAFAPDDNLVMFFRPNQRVIAFSPEKGLYETD